MRNVRLKKGTNLVNNCPVYLFFFLVLVLNMKGSIHGRHKCCGL